MRRPQILAGMSVVEAAAVAIRHHGAAPVAKPAAKPMSRAERIKARRSMGKMALSAAYAGIPVPSVRRGP